MSDSDRQRIINEIWNLHINRINLMEQYDINCKELQKICKDAQVYVRESFVRQQCLKSLMNTIEKLKYIQLEFDYVNKRIKFCINGLNGFEEE